jgi:hypothetical protein
MLSPKKPFLELWAGQKSFRRVDVELHDGIRRIALLQLLA